MILKCHRRCQTFPCDVLCIEQLIFVIYLYGFGQSPLLESSSEENGWKVCALGCVLNLYVVCLQKMTSRVSELRNKACYLKYWRSCVQYS